MSPQTLALIAACYGLLGGMILYGLIDFFRKGGTRDLRNWLGAEIECNVKLLKENAELRGIVRGDLVLIDPEKTYVLRTDAHMSRKSAEELLRAFTSHTGAKAAIVVGVASIDRASTEGASEEASAVPGHVDTLASSLSAHPCATYGHKFTHAVTPRKCVYCDLPEVSA